MSIFYVILTLSLVGAGGAVAAFMWTVRSGQLDDVDTPPRRILFEDECARVAPPVIADAGPAAKSTAPLPATPIPPLGMA